MKKILILLIGPILSFNSFALVSDSVKTKELGEVIVTGSNIAVGRNLLPYTVSSLTKERLESSGNNQLLSAISGMVPSLFITERNIYGFGVSNGGTGHIKMRGVGGDRASSVLMMVDGQPQFAGLYSHHVADFYQLNNVEKVEILRGPGSVLYGSNAMAGVINVITANPDKAGIKTTLSTRYGSYNTSISNISNTVNAGHFSSLVSGGFARTNGVSKGFDFKQWNTYAKVSYKISNNWHINSDFTLVQSIGNDPVYPSISNPESTDIYHQNIIRGEASLSANNHYNNTDGVIRTYYSYGNHFIDDPRHFHSLDDRLGLITYQNFHPFSKTYATVGFDFDRYTGKIPVSGGINHTPESMSTIERKQIVEYSPYITISQSIYKEKFLLNMGIRIANSSEFSSQVVPQIGCIFTPSEYWQIKGSVSKGYRNPSFRELYLYKMANPNLNPEKMWDYEISLEKSYGKWIRCELTAYYLKGYDMIQTVDQKNVNTGKFINKGIEFSASVNTNKNLQLWASYSYLHSSINNLTGAPRHQYYLGASWNPFERFITEMSLKGVASLYVSDEISRQNYALLNLRFKYSIITQLAFTLDLDNITNSKYIIVKGYPMPGFTVMGGIELKL